MQLFVMQEGSADQANTPRIRPLSLVKPGAFCTDKRQELLPHVQKPHTSALVERVPLYICYRVVPKDSQDSHLMLSRPDSSLFPGHLAHEGLAKSSRSV